MSEADKMFEELGYKKIIDNKKEVSYQYINTLMGDRIEQTIQITKIGMIVFSYRNNQNHNVMGIGIEESGGIRMDMNNTTSDKNVAQDIEFLKSNEADALYFRGNPKLKSAVESVLEKNKELEEVIENSIPTQKVENKLEELKKNYDEKYDLYMGYKVESREQQDILKQMSILQEILGESK